MPHSNQEHFIKVQVVVLDEFLTLTDQDCENYNNADSAIFAKCKKQELEGIIVSTLIEIFLEGLIHLHYFLA